MTQWVPSALDPEVLDTLEPCFCFFQNLTFPEATSGSGRNDSMEGRGVGVSRGLVNALK